MEIYTGSGDKGRTSLFDNTRVSKDSRRVESYGTVDELNSLLGFARNSIEDQEIASIIFKVQRDLFDLAGELATVDEGDFPEKITEENVEYLEEKIDAFLASMNEEEKSRFIVPGSSESSARLHMARTVCRRTERRIVSLTREAEIRQVLLQYINRLSDLIYTLARYLEASLDYVDFEKSEGE